MYSKVWNLLDAMIGIDLPSLQSIELYIHALNGRSGDPDCSLTMRSRYQLTERLILDLPKLTRLFSSGGSFIHYKKVVLESTQYINRNIA